MSAHGTSAIPTSSRRAERNVFDVIQEVGALRRLSQIAAILSVKHPRPERGGHQTQATQHITQNSLSLVGCDSGPTLSLLRVLPQRTKNKTVAISTAITSFCSRSWFSSGEGLPATADRLVKLDDCNQFADMCLHLSALGRIQFLLRLQHFIVT